MLTKWHRVFHFEERWWYIKKTIVTQGKVGSVSKWVVQTRGSQTESLGEDCHKHRILDPTQGDSDSGDLRSNWIYTFRKLLNFFFFYCYSLTVVCLFSPSLHPTPGEPTSLPPPPSPLVLSMCPYSSSCNPLYPLSPPPPPPPPWLLLDCS